MADKRSYDVERRLLSYALTAGAAMAVSAPSAAAGVITRTLDLSIPASSTPTPVALDVNNDGITDFLFSNYIGDGASGFAGAGLLTVAGNDSHDLFFGSHLKSGSVPVALTLPKSEPGWGPTVASKNLLPNGYLGFASSNVGGQFVPLEETGLLGSAAAFALPLTFDDNSGNQYWGWARVSTYLSAPFTLNAEIVDVGYESTPNAPIDIPGPTPEPGTLGMLALGAAGLLLSKRKVRKE